MPHQMTPDEFLNDLAINVYCRLKPSPTSGVGIFAVRTIPQGIQPFGTQDESFGELSVTTLIARTDIADGVKELVQDMCVIEGETLYYPHRGINTIDLSYFLNHSEHPNMITTNGGETFVAARDIEPNEELVVDYRTYTDR